MFLIQNFFLTANISTSLEKNNVYEAAGMLRALFELGPSVCFLPTMIRYFKVLVMTERGVDALQAVDDIYDILKNDLQVSFEECQQLGKKYYKEQDYLLSILFDLISNLLLPNVVDEEWILLGIAKSMSRLLKTITQSAEIYSCNETLKSFIVPRIRKSLVDVFSNIGGKSKKSLAIMEVACKHKMEQIERNVADIDASEKTLRESLDKMQNVLGGEAEKMHLLGTVLNNLGSTCLQQGKIVEAKDLLLQAIEVNGNAEDYDSEEERKLDIFRSTHALERVDEILKSMNK